MGPKLVLAGGYKMHINAYDQTGKLLLCLEGGLTVETGKDGEVIRKLDTCVPPPSHDCDSDLCGSCSSQGAPVGSTPVGEADKAHGGQVFWLFMGFSIVTIAALM